MRVLGIMSGTSLDGVDYATCEIGAPDRMRLLEHWSVRFPKALKERLHRAASNKATTYEVGELHHELGRFYAKGAGERAGESGIELIGLHGQTVFHHPPKATLQLGEPAYLAEQFRVPVISNFRAADIAAGGQGAPLATIFHRHVFARRREHVAVNNLGGISNVTSLDWREETEPRVLAFDTGPANVLIDMAARHFFRKGCDRNGALARSGKVSEQQLKRWLQHPYFKLPPPKSTGGELFGERFFAAALKLKMAPNDLLATFTELTARSIALNYRQHFSTVPQNVILVGGGSRNTYLVSRITAALKELNSEVRVHTSSKYGWDPQVIEASAFALLAWLTWKKKAGNIPATTGATGARILGQVTVCS